MVKKAALVIVMMLAVSVLSVLAYAATKPDTFRVARSVSIKAPPETIFPLINNLHSQLSWIPFDKDPNAKRSFSGVEAGKGAAYSWDGNSDVGAGTIEITEATVPSKVVMKLNMERPMEAQNVVEFTLDGNADATNVTWAMHGAQPYLAKLVSTFMDCETMVGDEFDTGLAKLKSPAENGVVR